MGISKDRFREALNEFYSKEVLFKLYNKDTYRKRY